MLGVAAGALVQTAAERRRPTALDGPQHLVLLRAQRVLRTEAVSVSACDLIDRL